MTESHFARHHIKKPFPCHVCCVKTTYDFVSPDGAKHEALREHTPCCQAMCGWMCCKPRFDIIPFKSTSVRAERRRAWSETFAILCVAHLALRDFVRPGRGAVVVGRVARHFRRNFLRFLCAGVCKLPCRGRFLAFSACVGFWGLTR
jgi:hypothetical protein